MTAAMILKDKGSAVYTAQAGQSLTDAAQILRDHGIGAVVIVDHHIKPIGVLSERDIVRALADLGAGVLDAPIRDFMSSDVISCTPDTPIDRLMETMTNRRVRHIPVVEGGVLQGIVSIGDVVRVKIATAEAEAEALKDYINAT